MESYLKLHTFGTSAGTQPYSGFHHTCLALETEQALYFLDAGECGAYTAHINGIDLLKTRGIFITHPHMDHVGGLGNLLWYIRKVGNVRKTPLKDDVVIDIMTPCLETVEGFMTVLKNTEGDFKVDYTHRITRYGEGVIFDNGDIKVTAVHTNHLPMRNEKYMSFAFIIEHKDKTVAFSGDMCLEDIEGIVPDKCDAFLVETGHHQIEDICVELKNKNKSVEKLFFVHHGGYIIKDMENAKKRAEDSFGKNVFITCDGETYLI